MHDVILAARKDEMSVRGSLDVGSEQCFDILFRIISNLLELVKGDNTRFVGIFQIGEYLFEGHCRTCDVAQFQVKRGHIGDQVDAEFSTKGFERMHKRGQHLLS